MSEEPNIEEAIEFYSKKWKVSKEEAAEKIKKLVQERKAPSMEELFPEPLGELSKKVQDVNQAVLSTAFTRKKLQDLEHPPRPASGVEQSIDEAVKDAGKQIITSKLTGEDPIRKKVDEALGDFVSGAIKEKLEGTNLQTQLEGMFQKFKDEVIKPLADQVQEVAGKPKGEVPVTADAAVDLVMDAQEKYRKFLESRGFSVESVHVSKEDVKKMLAEEEQKFQQRLEQEKKSWEEVSGAQVEIEKERVRATENILSGVVDRVMDMFLVPIKQKIEEAIEKGAFKGPPSGA